MTARGDRVSVGIVGGGIAGLYCAWKLAARGHSVTVFECLDRFGGRIETLRFERLPEAAAECGPMRFELAVQPLFRELLSASGLGIEFAPFSEVRADEIEFPRYKLAANEHSTAQRRKEAELERYFAGLLEVEELTPDIRARLNINLSQYTTTLHLLKYGVYRILNPDPQARSLTLPEVVEADEGRSALVTTFADRFTDAGGRRDYDVIRTSHVLQPGGQPLHEVGLWNALSHVLSSGAVAKIRDLGSFYHLMPENPSGSEWTIFWLRLFRSDAALSTIDPGVDTIVAKLVARLRALPERNVELVPNATITRVAPGDACDRVRLSVDFRRPTPQRREIEFDHVILALPQWPLRRLAEFFPPQIQEDIEGVIGFPLLKAFLVTDKPWWRSDRETRIRAQSGAHLIPTREVHYLEGQGSPSGLGMIMIYTDRPAIEYWQPYVRLPHERAQVNEPGVLKEALARHVYAALQDFAAPPAAPAAPLATGLLGLLPRGADFVEEALDRLFAGEGANVTDTAASAWRNLTAYAAELLGMSDEEAEAEVKQGITDFAIRDWSQPPFGAAAHAWAPGMHVVEVLDRLKAFSLLGCAGANNVHVCGEAYSDYQGFIEGALRSAEAVMREIP